ncbi:hypothetical protein ACFLXH_03215 [Chloroflexota bacterium]
MRREQKIIAYFSIEMGIDPSIPKYSGGDGILAGDPGWSIRDGWKVANNPTVEEL